MVNHDIRAALKNAGVKQWQLAERYGLSEERFSKKMRREIPEDQKAMLLGMIRDIAAERAQEVE